MALWEIATLAVLIGLGAIDVLVGTTKLIRHAGRFIATTAHAAAPPPELSGQRLSAALSTLAQEATQARVDATARLAAARDAAPTASRSVAASMLIVQLDGVTTPEEYRRRVVVAYLHGARQLGFDLTDMFEPETRPQTTAVEHNFRHLDVRTEN